MRPQRVLDAAFEGVDGAVDAVDVGLEHRSAQHQAPVLAQLFAVLGAEHQHRQVCLDLSLDRRRLPAAGQVARGQAEAQPVLQRADAEAQRAALLRDHPTGVIQRPQVQVDRALDPRIDHEDFVVEHDLAADGALAVAAETLHARAELVALPRAPRGGEQFAAVATSDVQITAKIDIGAEHTGATVDRDIAAQFVGAEPDLQRCAVQQRARLRAQRQRQARKRASDAPHPRCSIGSHGRSSGPL